MCARRRVCIFFEAKTKVECRACACGNGATANECEGSVCVCACLAARHWETNNQPKVVYARARAFSSGARQWANARSQPSGTRARKHYMWLMPLFSKKDKTAQRRTRTRTGTAFASWCVEETKHPNKARARARTTVDSCRLPVHSAFSAKPTQPKGTRTHARYLWLLHGLFEENPTSHTRARVLQVAPCSSSATKEPEGAHARARAPPGPMPLEMPITKSHRGNTNQHAPQPNTPQPLGASAEINSAACISDCFICI